MQVYAGKCRYVKSTFTLDSLRGLRCYLNDAVLLSDVFLSFSFQSSFDFVLKGFFELLKIKIKISDTEFKYGDQLEELLFWTLLVSHTCTLNPNMMTN